MLKARYHRWKYQFCFYWIDEWLEIQEEEYDDEFIVFFVILKEEAPES